MKRLVGILTVLMLAVSVFALDVSAGIRIDVNALDYDGTSFKALSVNNGTAQHENPLQFSVGTEKVGGMFKIWPAGTVDGDRTFGPVMGGWNLWFKPFDGVTVNLGNIGTNLFCEQIEWWRTETGSGDWWGTGIAFNKNGFFVEALVNTGIGGWAFSGSYEDDAKVKHDAVINPIYAKIGYGADFGTIGAFYNYRGKDNWKVGAGYANTFGNAYTFLNVVYDVADTNKISAELWTAPSIDIVSLQTLVLFQYVMDNADTAAVDESNPILKADVKASLNLGAPVTPYIRITNWWGDFIADEFGYIDVQPGIVGNFNGMSYDVGLKFTVAGADPKFKFAVPVVLKYNF